ncbi:MAG: hypothetical protein GY719_19005 [bacterium]|nr:hypothetical protein [bacterium]
MHTISEREFIRGNRDGSGGRNCSVNEIRWVGLLIIPILAACSPGAKLTPDPQARAELVVRVTDMATQTADPEALNAAVEALFAAGSEEAALELLRNVEEERASVLLRIARYTALRDREEESVGLVDEALGLASVDGDPVASAKALLSAVPATSVTPLGHPATSVTPAS